MTVDCDWLTYETSIFYDVFEILGSVLHSESNNELLVMIPHGTRDVIKTLNVNISTLRGAIEIVDPSLEWALDIESDFQCLMIVQLTSNYLISKGQIFSQLWRRWRHSVKTFVIFADVSINCLTFVGIPLFFFATRTERRNLCVQEHAQPLLYWW